jgi:hypothetical protein
VRRSYLDLAVLFLSSILVPCLIHAQSTGSIVGNVADSSGGTIVGAVVTITETGTNTSRVLSTDSAGRFVANVPTHLDLVKLRRSSITRG